MSKVYIAAPFFNPTQLERVELVKNVLREQGIEYFSPKDESMFKQGDDPAEILKLNCAAIDMAPYVIVITDDKDVGTIWEAGYAYAKGKKILYVWLGWTPEMKFNIMLAASGIAVHSYDDLAYQLMYYSIGDKFDVNDTKDFIYE
jgi:nucleoside 2-deoxyribosyltransferase